MSKKHYEIADRAWQPVVGCSPNMPCAPRCWARRTVARVVECQRSQAPARAEFFQLALTPDGQKWSGEVRLDEAHLMDPLRWRKPAVVATGFHGDWGRLGDRDVYRIVNVMDGCRQHLFMPLTKVPERLRQPLQDCLTLPNVSIGCSVMNQSEADKMLPAMRSISELGWRTHCWYEPALGPVDWTGWEFIELLIMGGESGLDARPCDLGWFRNSLRWCRESNVRAFVKQLGSYPRDVGLNGFGESAGSSKLILRDRKGSDMSEWPGDLRVRQTPEVKRG